MAEEIPTSRGAGGTAPTTQAVTVVQPSPMQASALTTTILAIGGIAAALVAIATLVALIHKALTKELKRDIADVKRDIGDLSHKMGNDRTRVDALEKFHVDAIARLTRLEANGDAVDKTLIRIDLNINNRFDQLAESIREMRHVTPRT